MGRGGEGVWLRAAALGDGETGTEATDARRAGGIVFICVWSPVSEEWLPSVGLASTHTGSNASSQCKQLGELVAGAGVKREFG